MPSFSQRQGIRPKKGIQRESMDDDLRNGLWSAIDVTLWDRGNPDSMVHSYSSSIVTKLDSLGLRVWVECMKQPRDTFKSESSGVYRPSSVLIREHFFEGMWWEAYDLLEFLIKASRASAEHDWATQLVALANTCLEAENAAYRVVGDEVAEITSEYEVGAIEDALDGSTRVVRDHLAQALKLFSDRKQPDYRNSIKESISAVEAACQAISGKPKATLGECLKQLKGPLGIHPALEKGLSSIYGYTSDSGGIRHALTEGTEPPTFADAKFMLVACSAFTSYLWTKAAENGIDISKPERAG